MPLQQIQLTDIASVSNTAIVGSILPGSNTVTTTMLVPGTTLNSFANEIRFSISWCFINAAG